MVSLQKRVSAFLAGLRVSGLPEREHIRAVADEFNLPITTARRLVRWDEMRRPSRFTLRR